MANFHSINGNEVEAHYAGGELRDEIDLKADKIGTYSTLIAGGTTPDSITNAMLSDGAVTDAKLYQGADGILARNARLMYRLDNLLTSTPAESDSLTVTDAARTPMAGLALYGRSTQDGTPTPSAPVSIESVAAANFAKPFVANGTSAGVAYDYDGTGTVTLSGTSTSLAATAPTTTVVAAGGVFTLPAGTYTVAIEVENAASGSVRAQVLRTNDVDVRVTSYVTGSGTASATFTLSEATEVIVRVNVSANSTVNGTANIAIYEGTTAYPYVPYGDMGLWARGFNQWDEQWELGNLDTSNGALINANNIIRSKNPIPILPSTEYYGAVCGGSSIDLIKCFYDENGAFISSQSSHGTFTTPAGAMLMRFRLQIAYGTTYNHDVCINLSGPKNGTYVPYASTVTPIDLDGHELRSLPDGTRDELTVGADGRVTLVQRVGSVDLGTLTWTIVTTGTYRRFYSTGIVSSIVPPVDANIRANCISPNYLAESFNDVYNTRSDGIVGIVNQGSGARGNVNIVDDRYSTVADFKAGVSGVPLYYALATPVTIDLGWTDAIPLCGPDLTAQAVPSAPFALTYERDLNVTLARLEAALAALA